MKKKRVETFRNIRYGDGRYTDSSAAVGPPVGLAQARPNNTPIYNKIMEKEYIY